MIGHPPTPPPPYSENPPETTPALPPQLHRPDAASVPPPPAEADLSGQASGSSPTQQETVSVSVQVEDNVQVALMAAAEEDEDEELITRRRHVTGDSGIEVCVCRLDVDEGSGLEEESDEEHRMCKVSGGECCSDRQQQTFRQKEHSPELAGQTASTSGDHMV